MALIPKSSEHYDTSKAVVVPAPWPHEDSDIPLDSKVRFGSLDNGLRYMIMPHSNPPGTISLFMNIDAGSLMEAEDQRGLVRFDDCVSYG